MVQGVVGEVIKDWLRLILLGGYATQCVFIVFSATTLPVLEAQYPLCANMIAVLGVVGNRSVDNLTNSLCVKSYGTRPQAIDLK